MSPGCGHGRLSTSPDAREFMIDELRRISRKYVRPRVTETGLMRPHLLLIFDTQLSLARNLATKSPRNVIPKLAFSLLDSRAKNVP